MKKNRPKLDLPNTQTDKILIGLSAAGIATMFALVAMKYSQLPEEIPIHFGLNRDADSYGKKWWIWFIPGLAVVQFLILNAVRKIPHTFNYPVEITDNNATIQYQLARSMMAAINLVMVGLFFIICWSMMQVAMGQASKLSYLVVPALLMLCVPLLFYTRKAKQLA